ncbi:MAG: peptidoglycan-binding protein [Elusimicrobia bacterium]|nr:peptidoglycan-binding protein [Elusimicrobiota bacterium]
MAAALETETVVEPVAPALEIKPDKDISTGKSLGDSDGIIRVAVEVKTVQKALKNAGFYEGAIDGKIGPRTKNAIAAFQKQHGLTADGIVGKKTWSEMKTYLDQ